MNECVFCRIAGGDLPSDVVAQGPEWLGFRDLSPAAPSHVLVVPRRHLESLDDLTGADGELALALLMGCAEVAAAEGLGAGYRVVTNVGAEGGQEVGHLHFHVFGGRRLGWPPG